MPTPKYHIYLEYSETEKGGFRFNITQEELVRTFSEPFSAGKPFWFLGRLLNPLKVTKTVLFWSYESANMLWLPNQETLIAAKDKKYVVDSIEKGKVKGAYLCTEKYLAKPQTVTAQSVASSSAKRRILVVCGADDEMKKAITSALSKLWLIPVLLCEEPSHGRKLLERSADYADVGFAVVLLSPDDFAYAKNEDSTTRKLKPRQEVVFELGYLLGKLGKANVLVFFKECLNFEPPTDFEGMKTVAFDALDSWKLALIRELGNSGYVVDAGRILE